jgi:hypothetical protein
MQIGASNEHQSQAKRAQRELDHAKARLEVLAYFHAQAAMDLFKADPIAERMFNDAIDAAIESLIKGI